MLTQAFHFRILEDSLKVMNKHALVLCQKLQSHCSEDAIDMFNVVALCALDIICETAMGCSIKAQENSESEYVKAVSTSTDIIYQRVMSPWLWSDFPFWKSYHGFKLKHCLRILHGFTSKVINDKLKDIENLQLLENAPKRKLAFLDLLIEASNGGASLTKEDIREEVDTFMFEGKIY